ncbi:MAG: MBL fold metallo-hydrolase [Clostridia bacterium]|nr:MBL fold metallo-hydrolase [Clostridia bacterium]
MTFYPLASSSKGNAYLVSDGDTHILLECGLTMKELRRRSPVPISSMDACFITHEHMDHAKCAAQLCNMGVPVYTGEGTAVALDLEEANCMEAHEVIHVGELLVTAFDTYHNTVQPFGYAIEDSRSKERLLFVIDTKNLNVIIPGLTEIAIECNYADDLLGRLTRLPDKVKERIRQSHMEVDTAVRYLHKLDLSKVKTIWLLHMSSTSGDAGRFHERFEQEFPGIEIRICKE